MAENSENDSSVTTLSDEELDSRKAVWDKEQLKLKQKHSDQDQHDWSMLRITEDNMNDFPGKKELRYLGGLDISFVKDDNVTACAALVVIEYPSLEIVYKVR